MLDLNFAKIVRVRVLLAAFAFFIGLAAIGSTRVQTRELTPGQPDGVITEWNAADEFAITQGGTSGVWTYGHSTSGVDDTFNLFTEGTTAFPCGYSFGNWTSPAVESGVPQLGRNSGATFFCDSYYWPSELIIVHPGYHFSASRRPMLRWTAPSAGTYLVNGLFQKHSPTTTTDVRILKNGTEQTLFSGNVNSISSQQAFNFTVTVATSDTLDFSIGSGGDGYYGDSTGLAVTIGQPVTSCATRPEGQAVWVPAENSPTDVENVNTIASLVGDAGYTNTGKVGRAFTFDGSGDYVLIADTPEQRPATTFTLEGWFKFNATSGIIHLAGKPIRNSYVNSYGLYLQDGTLRGLVGNATQYTRVNSGFIPQSGIWQHLAFTYSFVAGVSTLKLYANGIEVTSNVDGTANLPLFYEANPYPLTIGADLETDVPSYFLNGLADEVSLYDRALTQHELFELTKQGSFGKCAPPVCAQPAKGLVSWFQGETNALDSRSHNHGTPLGATFASGRVGQALSFDGIDDLVSVPDAPSLNPTTQITLEAWVYPTADSGGTDVVSMIATKEVPSGSHYEIARRNSNTCSNGTGIPSGNFVFLLSGIALPNQCSGWVDGGANLPLNAWSHVAVTYNGSEVEAYVNGVNTRTVFTSGSLVANTGLFRIGGRVDGQGYWTGRIDEVALYNRALADTEINSIYNAGQSGKCKPSPLNPAADQIAWFTADGVSDDFTGLNTAGTVFGANYKAGKVGQAFNFDGVDDKVVVPNSPSLNITGNQLTIEAWIKPDADASGFNGIVSMASSPAQPSGRKYGLAIYNTRSLGFEVNSANGYGESTTAAGSIPNGTFTHVAGVYNGSQMITYINGVQAQTLTLTGNIVPSTGDFVIGQFAVGGFSPFKGMVDETTVYNRALSPSEVAAIYNAGTAGKSKSVTTPVNIARSAKAAIARSFAPTIVDLGGVEVTFQQVTTAGVTSKNGLDLALLPALPAGATFTGLAYDISTTALYQNGSANDVQVCFNVPSLTGIPANQLRIYHLEGGVWANRTAVGATHAALCTTGLTSLSPFAIAFVVPTAANVSVSGRVTTPDGRGLRNAIVTMTDMQGVTRTAISSSFGYFSLENVRAGETYVIGVSSKRYQFTPRTINVADELTGVDFIAEAE